MDEGTTLADLLTLNLHEYEEEVRNIVDKAVKEMSMEKVRAKKQPNRQGETQIIQCVWWFRSPSECVRSLAQLFTQGAQ